MDIWLFSTRIWLFVVLCRISLADDDIFKLNHNNPNELNTFLNNVLQHKDDFSFVRDAAKYYQKAKKHVNQSGRKLKFHYLPSEEEILNEERMSFLQNRNKRRFHHNNRKNKIKTLEWNSKRSSRSINGNSLDFESSVHKTLVKSKLKATTTKTAQAPDYEAINLADLQQKAYNKDPDNNNNNNNKRSDYNLNDNKIIDDNNPNGNSLDSVDFGQNDLIDAYDDPIQSNQKFIEFNRHPYHKYNTNQDQYNHRIDLNKFVADKTPEITDTDVEDFYNQRLKRENHENTKFRTRQLKFLDDTMINYNNDDDDYDDNYERTRRDFLDKLDMNDEDNYKEDNPYLDELKEKNTRLADDTRLKDSSKKIDRTQNSKSQQQQPSHFMDKIKNIFHKTTQNSTNTTPKTNKRELELNEFDDRDLEQHLKDIKRYDVIDKIKGLFHKTTQKPTTYSKTKREDGDNLDEISDLNKRFDVFNKIKKILHKGNSTNSTKTGKREDLQFDDFDDIVEDDGRVLETRISRNSPENKKNDDILENLVNQLKFYRNDRDEEHVTTPLIPTFHYNNEQEHEGRNHDMINMEDEHLTKLINGQISSDIVTSVFNELSQISELKKRIYSGLSRKHFNFPLSVNMNYMWQNSSAYISSAELLTRLAENLNQFITKEIHHTNCHRLSDELYEFLKDLVYIKTDNGAIPTYVPNEDQDHGFLFAQDQQKEQHPEIAENQPNDLGGPVDNKSLEQTLQKLEKLLEEYRNLNDDYQNRAKPVKEYIEEHIALLKSLLKHGQSTAQLDNNGEAKLDMKRETKGKPYKSEQYKKLQRAVQQIREKRANEKKIGELFGEKMKRGPKFDINYEEPVIFNVA